VLYAGLAVLELGAIATFRTVGRLDLKSGAARTVMQISAAVNPSVQLDATACNNFKK